MAVIDAATFAIAAAATAMLRVPREPAHVPPGASGASLAPGAPAVPWHAQVTAGMSHLWRTPALRLRFGELALITAGAVDFVAATALSGTGVLPLAIAGALLSGFALPWCLLGLVCLGQRLSGLDIQGRVSAAITLLIFGPQPVTQTADAVLIARLSYHAVYAIVAAAIAVVLAASSRLKRPARPDLPAGGSAGNVGAEPGTEGCTRSEE